MRARRALVTAHLLPSRFSFGTVVFGDRLMPGGRGGHFDHSSPVSSLVCAITAPDATNNEFTQL